MHLPGYPDKIKYTFSVIIPTYNRAERLDVALNSLVAQTFKNFEVIICDDGSTDETKNIVDKYDKLLNIIYIWEENWGGPARPRNNGVRAASGEWIAFLDSDDWMFPQKLESVLPYMGKADFIYHDLKVYNKNGYTGKIKACRAFKVDILLDLLVNRNGICNSGAIVKREFIDMAGGFAEDKNLIAIEDYDLWIRISQLTSRFIHIPLPLGAYLSGGSNISGDYLRRNELEVYTFEKYKQLIPQALIPRALANLNVILSVNYVMADNSQYLKCLSNVLKYGSLRQKLWAIFNLVIGKSYIKKVVTRNALDS